MLSQANWVGWEASLPLTIWRDQNTVDALVKYLDEFYPNDIVTPEILNNAISILLQDGQLKADRPPYTRKQLKEMKSDKFRFLTQKFGMDPLTRIINGE